MCRNPAGSFLDSMRLGSMGRARRAELRIGLVVNPIAGLGGAVGLKGTDGPDTAAEALRRGAIARAGERVRRAFSLFATRLPGAVITCATGELGADWLQGLDLRISVRDLPETSGTGRDTRDAVSAMRDQDLIVFAGGDGTARDVAERLTPDMAMLGIPCGVKMHSGVFAVSPEAAGALLSDIVSSPERIEWDDGAEVMDIDEAALRAGRLAPRLYGHVRTPRSRNRMQAAKGGGRTDWSLELRAAATEVVAEMDRQTLYIIGPGTSAAAVPRAMGIEPSILGIDAIRDGRMVARDATAAQLEAEAGERPVRIVLGITGRQGFLIGRGNQQIGPHLIEHAGREGLIVLAARDKLASLAQPRLWVDTGDPVLDERISGYIRVKTGLRREMMMRVGTG